jgi:hypothetical protein
MIPAVDKGTQFMFDEGKLVGEYSHKLFKGGKAVRAEYWELAESNERSLKALKKRKVLFEAGFIAGETYSRADILVPVEQDEWDLIEVKSSTRVKDEHIQDVAFQKHCYARAGLKIRRCFLMHLNNEYIRKGKLDIQKLFVQEDITEQVNGALEGIDGRIEEMLKIMRMAEPPKAGINYNCDHPYECPLKDPCWKDIPENSVFNLYRLGKRAFELYEQGVILIEEIPEEYELNEKQNIQKQCHISKKPFIKREKIKEFLKQIKYPLYFMDFETYKTSIPLYSGLRPHQNIPFQFSVHVIEKEGETAKHISFIAEGNKDPRKAFFKQLKESIGNRGSIIVYNQSFESGVLEKLGELMPGKKKAIEKIQSRLVDLLAPFREFLYYDCRQNGSASLKAVLPALTGKGYGGLEIAEGGTASLQYFFITHGLPDGTKATPEEAKSIKAALEKYCGLDTEGMTWILEKLTELAT